MKKTLLLCALLCAGCVGYYDAPEDYSNKEYVTVSGIITNNDPAKVELQMATGYNLNYNDDVYIEDAKVILYDDLENSEILQYIGNGTYLGSTLGITGRSYHLEIELSNGEYIVSEPELLPSPTPITNLLLQQDIIPRRGVDGTIDEINTLNINLYLNEETQNHFFRWKLSGTYMMFSPLDTMDLGPCYITEVLNRGSIGQSTIFDKDLLSHNLASFEPAKKFLYAYYLRVDQFSLTPLGYDYWKQINEQKENVGSMFDNPPGQILGNLKYTQSDNYVLGNFDVSANSVERIMILNSDFANGVSYNFKECFPIDAAYFSPAPACIDCAVLPNSTHVKPDYWPQ